MRQQSLRFSSAFSAVCLLLLFPAMVHAGGLDLEKKMHRAILQSRLLLVEIQENLRAGNSVTAQMKALKGYTDEVLWLRTLLDKRFEEREEALQGFGPEALERHQQMVHTYQEILDEFLALVEEMFSEDATLTPGMVDSLKILLDGALPEKKRPILGTLPYRALNLPALEPRDAEQITPAYKGGEQNVSDEDLQGTQEAPISMEIATLAESLHWNPVEIYEWVKNNIETEWYWGCMKGAEDTLRQKSGNDADQACLLVALLRASRFPARFVLGTIEFFPDLGSAKRLTGIEDERELVLFFQKTGIPHTPVIAGGKIQQIQVEHVWVESYIPYANYRGAVIDEHGKTWLGLDTSIKVTGYEFNDPPDVIQEIDIKELADEYLQSTHTETPLEYVRQNVTEHLEVNHSGTVYEDLLATRSLIPETLNILPASLQFKQVRLHGEYTQLPAELLHRARFKAIGPNNVELFDVTVDAFRLSNKPVVITYQPETVEDQEIANAYGGLGNTPSYLVRVRPVLEVEGITEAVGRDGLSVGTDYKLTMELISPDADTQTFSNSLFAGNLSVIGFVSQQVVLPQEVSEEELDGERLLLEQALNYIDRWNHAEEELAALMQVRLVRPLPTVVTMGGVVDITYLLDSPHGFEWKGVYVDADFRAAELVDAPEFYGPQEARRIFMRLASLEGSALEDRIFEQGLQVEAISTAKLLGFAAETGYASLLSIDAGNIDTTLPFLLLPDYIKEDITNAVIQGFDVLTLDREISYEDWTGIGYVKEDHDTGEAGWMLSGMIAGGMTVWGTDRWDVYYRARLENPLLEPPNLDPESALYIQKMTATDMQHGTVGVALRDSLEVRVMDVNHHPVMGHPVIFRVVAGGGTFADGSTLLKANTDFTGAAKADLTLGTNTSANPTKMLDTVRGPNIYQVGENIVSAELESGTSISVPFVAYGFPGPATELERFGFRGQYQDAIVNTYAGTVNIRAKDQYGNGVSNVEMTFEAKDAYREAEPGEEEGVPLPDSHKELQLVDLDACPGFQVVYGQCEGLQMVAELTGIQGAAVGAIVGNTVSTIYPIDVSAPGVPTLRVNVYSGGHTTVDWESFMSPPTLFAINYSIVNSKGEPANAAMVNDALEEPLVTVLVLSSKDYEMEAVSTGQGIRYRIVPVGTYSTTPVNDAQISFETLTGGGKASEAESRPNGVYAARYALGPVAAVNTVLVDGEATVMVPELIGEWRRQGDGPFGEIGWIDIDMEARYQSPTLRMRQVTLKVDEAVAFDDSPEAEAIVYNVHKQSVEYDETGRAFVGIRNPEYTVYGVDFEIPVVVGVEVDSNGTSTSTSEIQYKILPEAYRGTTASVFIVKDGERIAEI